MGGKRLLDNADNMLFSRNGKKDTKLRNLN